MSQSTGASHTIRACLAGYVVQAIINNFAPLLFLTFQSDFQIGLEKVALITTVNFSVQLIVDALSAKFVDQIGYRASAVLAHAAAAAGLAAATHRKYTAEDRVQGSLGPKVSPSTMPVSAAHWTALK